MHSVCFGRHSLHTGKELAETGQVGIEHLQDFLLVDMVRMQIVTDFQHLIRQSQGIVVLQRHLGLMSAL